jgi:two-component system, NarL family, response regulator NreC
VAIRILLADDHALFRAGMRRILVAHPELSVVAETSSGLEAVELARLHQPDVAIVDIGLNEMNGVEATAQIVAHSPATAVLILSMHSDERYVVRAVRAGAKGYVLKDSVEDGLIESIVRIYRGEPYFSPSVARTLRDRQSRDPKLLHFDDLYESLTERERQLYHLLAEGNSSKEIAARLGISVHTVETHRTHIMDKLQIHSVAELVLSAVRRGLICT